MTNSSKAMPKSKRPAAPTEQSAIDKRLDEALNESFPASDPIAVSGPKPADTIPAGKK